MRPVSSAFHAAPAAAPPPPSPSASPNRPASLLLLFAGVNLVIGSSAFMSAGLLEPMATSVGSTVAAVGQATTVYAVATALLSPLVLTLAARLPQHVALALVLGVFTLGNALTALATSLPVLLGARVLMGAGSAATALMAGITVTLVEGAQRARALALVFLGISLAYVTGVPLATWIGLAHGWQVPAWIATALCALSAVALWRAVPARPPTAASPLAGLGALLRQRQLWGIYALTFTYFVAIFCVFSYLGPLLPALVPMDRGGLSALISVFGVAGVAGTLLGGRAADRLGPRRTILAGLAAMVASLALMPLTQGHLPALVGVLMVWGCAGFCLMAPQQLRLAQLAGPLTPLALSLNSSVLYLGTAAGAAAGGWAMTTLDVTRLPWIGAPTAAMALVWAWMSVRTEPPRGVG